MALKVTILVCLCFWLRGLEAARVLSDVNETEQGDSEFNCANYCVYCNNGDTIWYGRSRSWFRAMINLFTEGALIPIAGVANMYFKADKEEYTHWTGYLPTTGLFCEKVDVVKFPASNPAMNAFQPLMLYDRNWFGKISLNELKPYTPAGYSSPKPWAQPGDV